MNKPAFILDFIKRHELAVISTIHPDNTPQSAVVGFGESGDLKLVFGTSNTSRKYRNLQANAQVSVVIGGDKGQTVQYEGTAKEVTGDEAEHFKQLYFAKTPSSRKYEDLPDERYFVITPAWIRYTDLTQEPWHIVELSFK